MSLCPRCLERPRPFTLRLATTLLSLHSLESLRYPQLPTSLRCLLCQEKLAPPPCPLEWQQWRQRERVSEKWRNFSWQWCRHLIPLHLNYPLPLPNDRILPPLLNYHLHWVRLVRIGLSKLCFGGCMSTQCSTVVQKRWKRKEQS